MALDRVWVRTLSDGLVRADHIIGLSNHQTPELPGKASHWLLDATLAIPAGTGTPEDGWDISASHRTLIQTSAEQLDAPADLARLLARLAAADAAGIIDAHKHAYTSEPTDHSVEFVFTEFDIAETP